MTRRMGKEVVMEEETKIGNKDQEE